MTSYYTVLKVKHPHTEEYSSDDLYCLAAGQGALVLYDDQDKADSQANERAQEEQSHFLVCEVSVTNDPENDELDGETRKRSELDFHKAVSTVSAPATNAKAEGNKSEDTISGEFYVVLPERNVKEDDYGVSDLGDLASQLKQSIALIPNQQEAEQLAYYRAEQTKIQQLLFRISYKGPNKPSFLEEIDEGVSKEYQPLDLNQSQIKVVSWGYVIEKKQASHPETESRTAGLPGFTTARALRDEEQRKREEEGRRMLRTAGSFDAALLLSGGPAGASASSPVPQAEAERDSSVAVATPDDEHKASTNKLK